MAITAPPIDTAMFILTIVQFIFCSSGLVMNGFLAFVIIRTKKLRFYSCGLLILALAITDCIAEFFLATLSTFLTMAGITIPLLTCFWLDFYCTCSQNIAQLIMASISIDRLVSLLFPLSYKRISMEHKVKYISLFLVPPTIYGCYLAYLFYNYAVLNANREVYCMPSDYVDQNATNIIYTVLMCANLVMIIIYSLIWLMLKCKVVNLHLDSSDHRIYKSLMALLLVTFFCWLPVPVMVSIVFPHLSMSTGSINVLQRALLQMTKAAQAVNMPILYICSSQYRNAMRKELKWLKVKMFPQSQIHSIHV